MTTNAAETKYPVFLIHGMGFRDYKYINYWGRIPKKLSENGASVFYGHQDSNGSIESNAKQIEKELIKILEKTGAEKVNIIAHSKGGLEARYLISSMGYGDRVASLTTLATPHNGSATVDKLMHFPKAFVKAACSLVNIWMRILGDKTPDTYSSICSLRTADAKKFNSENPDNEAVFYQSYAFAMKSILSDVFMSIPWLVVYLFEGENDGLLSPTAAKWTNFRGVVKSVSRRGISHCDEVDIRRRPFSRKDGEGIRDITDFYLNIAIELKNNGF